MYEEFGKFKLDYIMPSIFADMSPACRRRAQKLIEHHYYPHIELHELNVAADLIELAIGLSDAENARLASIYAAA